MDDLTITKLCAEAVGIKWIGLHISSTLSGVRYDPLHDKAQAMELVERLHLHCRWNPDQKVWFVSDADHHYGEDADLLRAICLCAAKAQQAKKGEK